MAKRVSSSEMPKSRVTGGEDDTRQTSREPRVWGYDVKVPAGGKWSVEEVKGFAEKIPELYVEFNTNLTKVAQELGLGDRPANARSAIGNLCRHHPSVAEAVQLGKDLMTDKFADHAVNIGLGIAKTRNNYPGMKWLEAHASDDWSVTQKVQVDNTGFSADELRKEASGETRVALEVLSGGKDDAG